MKGALKVKGKGFGFAEANAHETKGNHCFVTLAVNIPSHLSIPMADSIRRGVCTGLPVRVNEESTLFLESGLLKVEGCSRRSMLRLVLEVTILRKVLLR